MKIYFLAILFFSSIAFGKRDTIHIENGSPIVDVQLSIDDKKIENKSLDKLIDKITEEENQGTSIWTTLIPLLIGAGLTFLTQFIIEYRRTHKDKAHKKLEIKADLHRIQHLIKDHYRELAMHKAHKFYWYAQHKSSELDGNKEEIKKFYASHMKSSENVREVELKLAETFSQFYKQVIKFQQLSVFDKNLKKWINDYYDYTPAKPQTIDYTKSDLPKEENKEEERLKKEYEGFSRIIAKIVDKINGTN